MQNGNDAASWSLLCQRANKVEYKGRFPTTENRVHAFEHAQTEVEKHARETRPILDAKTVGLMESFINHKRAFGSGVERRLYADMDWYGLLGRILTKRPLVFITDTDTYMLRDGTEGSGGFEQIGTDHERSPLLLDDLMSYDEMQLSALCGISMPTHFINKGDRHNKGIAGQPGTYETTGVYVALVGARYERPGRMEWQYTVITREQNTTENGYGPDADAALPQTNYLRMWSAVLCGHMYLPTYDQAVAAVKTDSTDFLDLGDGSFFFLPAYLERIRMSVEPFLHEANDRASSVGKRAYVHVVGLGLGVWMITESQGQLIVDVFAKVLRSFQFRAVADIDFSFFPDVCNECDGTRDGGILKAGSNAICIHFSKRDPAAKLIGEDDGKLLVAMFAWDGNSYVGNEYWLGDLTGSGDPAAAACSMAPDLQNPDVNLFVAAEHAKVWGKMAMVSKTQAELADEIKDTFRVSDAKVNGTIRGTMLRKDLVAVLQKCGLVKSEEWFDMIFQEAGVAGSPYIDYGFFVDWLAMASSVESSSNRKSDKRISVDDLCAKNRGDYLPTPDPAYPDDHVHVGLYIAAPGIENGTTMYGIPPEGASREAAFRWIHAALQRYAQHEKQYREPLTALFARRRLWGVNKVPNDEDEGEKDSNEPEFARLTKVARENLEALGTTMEADIYRAQNLGGILGSLGDDVEDQWQQPRQDSVLQLPPNWNSYGEEDVQQGDKIFIAFISMCAHALNKRFQSRSCVIADKVPGCKARNVDVKGHLRMDGKLFHDHADMEFPRAAHNADIVRCALICTDAESLRAAFEMSRHPVYGVGKIVRVKNHFTPKYEAMSEGGSFGYRACLVNYIMDPGVTWGELLEESEADVSKCLESLRSFHTKSTARFNELAMCTFASAEKAFRSLEFLSTPAKLLVEVQFMTEEYLVMRKRSHFWYKVARAASGFHLCQDFRAVHVPNGRA